VSVVGARATTRGRRDRGNKQVCELQGVLEQGLGACIYSKGKRSEKLGGGLQWRATAEQTGGGENVRAQEERLGLLYSGRRRLGAQDNHNGRGTDVAWARGVRCVRRCEVGRAAWSARRRPCARGAWRPGRGPGWWFARAAHGAWT
jgi:hypothetical protein